LDNAQTRAGEFNHDLDLARKDSVVYANYKTESEKRLKGNQLLIADMKDNMNSGRIESPKKYERLLDSLDMRNLQLRNNMQMYSAENRAEWEMFKKDFNKDLDALDKSIALMADWKIKKG
jgi:hypothetical protein